LTAVQRIQPNLEDEKQFIPQMVNQAGKLSPTNTTRESAVDEVLAKFLQFLGSKAV